MEKAALKSSKLIVAALAIAAIFATLLFGKEYMNAEKRRETQYIVELYANDLSNWTDMYLAFIRVLSALPVMREDDDNVIYEWLKHINPFMPEAVDKIIYLNKSGKGFYGTGEISDLFDRQYYKDVVLDQKINTQISDPFYTWSTQSIEIAFSNAVKDPKGEAKGMIYLAIKGDALYERAQGLALAEGGYGFLIDRSGKIFAHPRQEANMKSVKELDLELGTKGFSKYAEKLADAPKSGNFEYTGSNGKRRVLFYAQIAKTPGFIYAASISKSEIEKEGNVFFITFLIAAFISIVSAFLVFYRRGRSAVKIGA
ncbi:MAG: cache domain-containing protein [Helicobacteraceae bacterium]|jgi:methyl-accepting chemotaxis protein|nr:cache domain-containing protein [Helicobacteraceae bacterium]